MDRRPPLPPPGDERASRSGDFAQSAAEWVVRRDAGLSPDQRQSLRNWEDSDPGHSAELARMQRTWRSLDGIGEIVGLQAMADEIAHRYRRRRRRRFLAGALAAAAAVAAGFLGWTTLRPETPQLLDTADRNYRVLASTLQRMLLPDGSVAELNGDSRIEVDFSPAGRHIQLLEGEAHFVVVRNQERPFYVTAGAVTVRAVGTAFNVRLASELIEVLVTAGKVKLEPTPPPPAPSREPAVETAVGSVPRIVAEEPGTALVAGQRAIISRIEGTTPASAAVGEVDGAGIAEALSWQSVRLVFNNTPLADVVEGFNRCNSHRLTIGDPSIRGRALTGVFRADNVEGFVRLLRHSIDVKGELRTPTETVLLPVR